MSLNIPWWILMGLPRAHCFSCSCCCNRARLFSVSLVLSCEIKERKRFRPMRIHHQRKVHKGWFSRVRLFWSLSMSFCDISPRDSVFFLGLYSHSSGSTGTPRSQYTVTTFSTMNYLLLDKPMLPMLVILQLKIEGKRKIQSRKVKMSNNEPIYLGNI